MWKIYIKVIDDYSDFKRKLEDWKLMFHKSTANWVIVPVYFCFASGYVDFASNVGIPSAGTISKEERNNVESLQEYASSLKTQLNSANKRVLQLMDQLEKTKKETERLKKVAYLNKRPPISNSGAVEPTGVLEIVPGKTSAFESTPREHVQPIQSKEALDSGLLDVARSLKQR